MRILKNRTQSLVNFTETCELLLQLLHPETDSSDSSLAIGFKESHN